MTYVSLFLYIFSHLFSFYFYFCLLSLSLFFSNFFFRWFFRSIYFFCRSSSSWWFPCWRPFARRISNRQLHLRWSFSLRCLLNFTFKFLSLFIHFLIYIKNNLINIFNISHYRRIRLLFRFSFRLNWFCILCLCFFKFFNFHFLFFSCFFFSLLFN